MIAIIPARKGSKRLPNKNKMPFCGKPLIYWTIRIARVSGNIRVFVSTDDTDIATICTDEIFAKTVRRPKELAEDDSNVWDAVRHTIDREDLWNERSVILLQPTSPLRLVEDVENTVCLGYNSMTVSDFCDGHFCRPNGAVYHVSIKSLFERSNPIFDKLYIMPRERSIDIDTIEDFKEAERLMNERNKL